MVFIYQREYCIRAPVNNYRAKGKTGSFAGEKRKNMIKEITCPNCNFSKKVPEEKIPQGVRWAKCPRCKNTFEFDLQGAESVEVDSQPDMHNKDFENIFSPWELRMSLGLWTGIWQTIAHVLFLPGAFFRQARGTGGIREPLAFGILTGSLGKMISFFWIFLFMAGVSSEFTTFSISASSLFLILIIVSPLYVVISMFITGCVTHIFLMLFRGGRKGFAGTFRVIAFSQSAGMLSLVPLAGDYTGIVWRFVITVTGLMNIHKSSFIKVTAALVFQFIIKMVLYVLFAVIIMGIYGALKAAL